MENVLNIVWKSNKIKFPKAHKDLKYVELWQSYDFVMSKTCNNAWEGKVE